MGATCIRCGNRIDHPGESPEGGFVCARCRDAASPNGTRPPKIGKYTIREEIGVGERAVVYRAREEGRESPIALKVMIPGETGSAGQILAFVSKARIAARLLHPNIVPILEVGVDGPVHYIATEYVDGESLQKWIDRKETGVDRALRIGLEVASGLEYAHDQGVVHRNLKPSNVLIDRQGKARIVDFGIGRSLDDVRSAAPTPANARALAYISPEQAFCAPEEIDARTDLYSLGAMMYELMSGRPPFEGPTPLAVLRRLEEETPTPLSKLDLAVPETLDAIIRKALEKDRERRYGSARDLIRDLEACSLKKGKEASKTPEGSARNRLVWPIAALVLAAVAVGLWKLPRPAPANSPIQSHGEERPSIIVSIQTKLDEAARSEDANPRLANLDGALRLANDQPPDSALRRMRAEIYMRLGCFSLAARDLDGVLERDGADVDARVLRVICRAASVRALPFFMAPGLWPTADPAALRNGISALERLHAPVAQIALLSALERAVQYDFASADHNLETAETGAPRAFCSFVRAHLEIRRSLPHPNDPGSRRILSPLIEQLRRDADELYLSPLLYMALHFAGREAEAKDELARLRARAPESAETSLMQAVGFFHQGDGERAWSEVVETALREREDLQVKPVFVLIRTSQVIADPDGRGYQDKEFAALLRSCEAPTVGGEPLRRFLEAWLRIPENRLRDSEEILSKLREEGKLARAYFSRPELACLASVGGTRLSFLSAIRDIDGALRRVPEAVAACDEILKLLPADPARFSEEERRLASETHFKRALLMADEPDDALPHLEEALRLGWPAESVERESGFGSLREHSDFKRLLRTYRKP